MWAISDPSFSGARAVLPTGWKCPIKTTTWWNQNGKCKSCFGIVYLWVIVDNVTLVWLLQENLKQQVKEFNKINISEKDIHKKKEVYFLLNAQK